MEEQKGWLQAKKRHEALLVQAKKFAGISIIATLVVGPLLYFSVFAGETEKKFSANLHKAATPEVEIAATAEITLSEIDIPFPERKERNTKFKTEDLGIELNENKLDKIINKAEDKTRITAQNLNEESIKSFETMFQEDELEIRSIKSSKIKETREVSLEAPESTPTSLEENETLNGFADENGLIHEEILEQKEETLIINNLELETGPSQIKNEKDASQIARTTIKKYTQTLENRDDFVVLPDTSKLDKQTRPEQLVLSKLVNHNGKWYIWFDQYHEGKPVFDGEISLILTESKKLLTLTDTIKLNLPSSEELKVGKALAKKEAKEILKWDDSYDDIEHIEQGFYNGELAYKVEAEAHNPLGTWEVYVDGMNGEVIDVMSDIRMQGPATPQPSTEPEAETPATTEPETENPATTEPETLLEATVGQILGYIFPETLEDERIQMPFRDQYVYIGDDATLTTTDADGYFENLEQEWYSMFLSGPYVTVYDDAATTNTAITNNTPGVPFIWNEPYASPEAINAFYHTNKIRDYFYIQHGYEMNVNIPVTVNSELADAYVGGCNSWYNNTEKTIELGNGTGGWCGDDTNYALSSDIIYHEYTHAITENIGHWPYITGSEAAAISEGLSDYFATTINDDSIFGEIASPDRIRNLNNTANYQTNMTGDVHDDSMPFAGALWDLREEIGTEKADALIFNTLYQNKTHFETFMYGMIIEDDDDEDFSNGTPHLIEIIQAFENHGIGPGVLNFNGLPIDPEAWSQLLADAGIEGEESDLYGAWSGTPTTAEGCVWSGSALTVPAGKTCRRNLSTDTAPSNILVYGTLYINATMTGSYGATGYTRIYNGGTVYMNSSVDIAGSLITYSGGRLYVTGLDTLDVNSYVTVNLGGDIYIYGDSILNVGYNLYVYGDLFIGWTSTASDGGDVNVTNDSYIYDGGKVTAYSCPTCIDADFDTTDELEIQDGGYMNIYERSDGSAGTLTAGLGIAAKDTTVIINGDWNVSTTKDVNINAYSPFYAATVTVGSAGRLYARNLNIGTDTQEGGNLTNNNAIYTYGVVKMGNYGTFTNNEYFRNSYSTILQSVTLYNGAFFENNDRADIYGYTYMYDNCDIQNDGEASDSYFKTSRLYMSELTTEADLGPVFTNNSSYGTLDIDTASSNNDIYMYQDAVLDNNSGANVDLYDDLQMFNDSLLTNDGSFYMYGPDNILYMLNNAEIINGASDRFWIGADNDNQTPTQGTLDINTSGNTVSNTGQFRMHTLDMDEGLISNKSGGGDMRIYGNAAVTRGTLQNIYGSTNFDITGTLTLDGPSVGFEGTLDNDGSVADIEGSTIMNAYSFIDNSRALNLNGGLEIAANNADIKNDYTGSDIDITGNVIFDWDIEVDCDGAANGDLSATGYINLEDTAILYAGAGAAIDTTSMILYDTSELENNGGTVTITNNLTTEHTSVIDNNSGTIDVNGTFYIYNDFSTLTAAIDNGGTIEVYEDILMTPRMANDGLTEFENTGTVTIDGSTTNILKIEDSNRFDNNGGTLTVNGTSGNDDGDIFVFESATLYNTGDVTARRMFVGDSANTTNGGYFTNATSGNLSLTTISTLTMDIYEGVVANSQSTGSFEVDGTIVISGDSVISNFNNTGDGTSNGLKVLTLGTANFNNGTFDTTNIGTYDTYVLDDNGAGTYIGDINISTVGELIVSDLYIGDGTDNPGTVDNEGTLTVEGNAYVYGISTAANDLDNASTGTINIGTSTGETLYIYDQGRVGNSGDLNAWNIELSGNGTNSATLDNRESSSDLDVTETVSSSYGIIYNGGGLMSGADFDADTLDLGTKTVFHNATNLNVDTLTIDSGSGSVGDEAVLANASAGTIDTTAYAGGTVKLISVETNADLYNVGIIKTDDLTVYGTGTVYNDYQYGGSSNTVSDGDTLWTTTGITNGIDIDVVDTTRIYGGDFENYDSFTTLRLWVGSSSEAIDGGTFTADTDSRVYVTSTGTDSAEVYADGIITIESDSDSFQVGDNLTGGRLTLHGSWGFTFLNPTPHAKLGKLENFDNLGTFFYDVYVDEYGWFDENALGSYIHNNLNLDGTSTANAAIGVAQIQLDTALLRINNNMNVNAFGKLINNNELRVTNGVSVTIDGVITSDDGTGMYDGDSDFDIDGNFYSEGTVDMLDVVDIDGIVEIDGGITTIARDDNPETSYIDGEIIVANSGTLNTYAYLVAGDSITVTDASSNLNFEDSINIAGTAECYTSTANGNFSVLNSGTATINCDRNVKVGNMFTWRTGVAITGVSNGTYVNGASGATLNVNTRLSSTLVEVGTAGGNPGTITHDIDGSPTDGAADTMTIYAEDITIYTAGEINVDGKSTRRDDLNTTLRGGSFGGLGQITSGGTQEATAGHPTEWGTTFGNRGMGSAPLSGGVGGNGGGLIHLIVSDTLTNNGTISANGVENTGGSYAGGSGGSINIGQSDSPLATPTTITGSGSIEANGADASAADRAGGGGRIYIEYDDKSGFSGGTVQALGGQETGGGAYYAETGTIFYKWTDIWQNQNDGTILIDGFNQGDDIDADGDGTTAGAGDSADYTTIRPSLQSVSVESIQLENEGYAVLSSYDTGGDYLDIQQCIKSSDSNVFINIFNNPRFNRDHGPDLTGSCFATPDPPHTLYLNNTITGAQSAQTGDEGSPASVYDLTPNVSAIHNDGELDSTPGNNEDTDSAYQYQMFVASSAQNLFDDTVTCAPTGVLTAATTDNSRISDEITTGCNSFLYPNSTYFWKIRFQDDDDGNTGTTTDQGWGLWSATQTFETTEGGSIAIGDCSVCFDGSSTTCAEIKNTLTGANLENNSYDFDKNYCDVSIESSVGIYLDTDVDQVLTHTTDGSYTIPYMDLNDVDNSVGGGGATDFLLDGLDTAGTTDVNEVGWYMGNVAGGLIGNIGMGTNGSLYDASFHKLQDTVLLMPRPVDSATAINSGSFEFWLGTYVHLFDDNGDALLKGSYDATTTLTLSTHP
jgi:hypothetical protein